MYNKFSEFLKNKYGEKVYKLPVNLPVTCPNRDGRLSSKGCIFCGDEGAGFENLSCKLSVSEQLHTNMDYISSKYNAHRFIAYFQNYSNTYLPLEDFKKYIEEACIKDVLAIYISTRPDCINDAYMNFLSQVKKEKSIDVVVELGLQTINYKTLQILNRGHLLAEFIDAVIRVKKHELDCCAHVILDLPMDSMLDVIETARVLSALGVNQIKGHSLYILKDTVLGGLYEKGELVPISMDEYIERVCNFLDYLDPQIVIQRLIGRAPEERTLFCNWGKSWWKVHEIIEQKMASEQRNQGRLFNYLNGKITLQ